jgi:hypothetical protein
MYEYDAQFSNINSEFFLFGLSTGARVGESARLFEPLLPPPAFSKINIFFILGLKKLVSL